MKTFLRRTVSAPSVVLILILGGACNGSDSREVEVVSDSVDPSATITTVPASSVKLMVQMTGLLLVVPRASGTVDVLLPSKGDHVAWMGFGMGSDSSVYANSLCDDTRSHSKQARSAGICYVDLKNWTLNAVGTGGNQVPNVGDSLPPELVNVTYLSGNRHKARTSNARRIELAAGVPGADVCKLATWKVAPYGGNTSPQELINRLDWEITGGFQTTLSFTSTAGSYNVSLPPPDSAGKIYILLAHVHNSDLGTLPPASSTTMSSNTGASHFDAYYTLLDDPQTSAHDPPMGDRRRSPTYEHGTEVPCSAWITLPARRQGGDTLASEGPQPQSGSISKEFWSLATYGCVLARADGS